MDTASLVFYHQLKIVPTLLSLNHITFLPSTPGIFCEMLCLIKWYDRVIIWIPSTCIPVYLIVSEAENVA